ncbi:MAG TPA: DUF2130 domain-containing protein [Arachidicoccus soli]|nr:DUF2130 domain-containing protein [Arachidicoccus soli]
MMAAEIKCPNCGYDFDPGESFKKEVQVQLRAQMEDWKKQKETEFSQKEELLKQQEANRKLQWEEDLKKKNKTLEENIRKSLASDFENEIKLLKESASENEEKLKTARQKELEFLHKEKALKEREAEMELQVQRQIILEREKLKEQLQKEEAEKNSLKESEHVMRVRELEKQLNDQKKLAEEMRRKVEQGSMQLQGEVQELELENLLRETFPFDKIEEVAKGVKGADCILSVHNRLGNEAGKIIFESKRTKDFNNEWIEKLKKDMRSLNADIAVIVTQTLPKDMERFGEKDGIYICNFAEVRSVVLLLRNGLLKFAEARQSQENKGDKMVMLYDYLTGHEFGEQWKAISEGFRAMRNSIQKERDTMERLWKAREKQLEKVLLNATHIRGSIEGIAGSDTINLSLTDDEDLLLLE